MKRSISQLVIAFSIPTLFVFADDAPQKNNDVPVKKEAGEIDSKKDDLSKEEIAARDFSFEGVRLGIELEKFLEKHPDAEKLECSDDNLGCVRYAIKPKSARVAQYLFFKKSLFFISVDYTEDQIRDVGGEKGFVKKIKDKIGDFKKDDMKFEDEDNRKMHILWEFKKVNRKFGYMRDDSVDKKSHSIGFFDSAVADEIGKLREAKADVGF